MDTNTETVECTAKPMPEDDRFEGESEGALQQTFIDNSDLERLESELNELNDEILMKKRKASQIRKQRAAQLRKKAAELKDWAAAMLAEADSYDPPGEAKKPDVSENKAHTPRRRRTTKKTAKKATKKVAKRASKKSVTIAGPSGDKPTAKQVLKLIKGNPGILSGHVAAAGGWGQSETTVVLRELEANGLVTHEGNTRGTKWTAV
jgi:uncharacterized protein YdcH (DUF465 family)